MNKANVRKFIYFCFIFSSVKTSTYTKENVVAMLLDVNSPQFHGFLERILKDIHSFLVIPAVDPVLYSLCRRLKYQTAIDNSMAQPVPQEIYKWMLQTLYSDTSIKANDDRGNLRRSIMINNSIQSTTHM